MLKLALIGWVLGEAYEVFNPMKVDFTVITPKNFGGSLVASRSQGESQAMLMYHDKPKAKEFVNSLFEPLALKLKGISKLHSVDCGEHAALCEKEDPSKAYLDSPTIRMFPPYPRPTYNFKGTLEEAIKAVISAIPKDSVMKLTSTHLNDFLNDGADIPKAIYMAEKGRASPAFYSIANSMSDRVHFGVAGKDDEGLWTMLSQKGKVKKYPAVISYKAGKYELYPGDIKDAPSLFNWVNIRSETFVKGGGFISSEAPEEPAWTKQAIPELNKDSNAKVCFKNTNANFCAVYVTPNESLSKDEEDMLLKGASTIMASRERDITFKFVYFSTALEPALAAAVGLSDMKEPHFMLINAKKLKYTEGVVASGVDPIMKVFEDLKSGSQRFKKMKGGLPKFTVRKNGKEVSNDEL